MRTSGTVKFFNSAKGFGFITPDGGSKDVFVHATAVEAAGMRALNQGDRVSFELEDDRRGRGKQAAQLEAGVTGTVTLPASKPPAEQSAGGVGVRGRRPPTSSPAGSRNPRRARQYRTPASSMAANQPCTARPASRWSRRELDDRAGQPGGVCQRFGI